jgi:pilus assembly protein CpaB
LVILTLAIVCGGAAAYIALAYLRQSTPRLIAAEAPQHQVAVAARDLPLGTVLKTDDVRMIDWRSEAVPQGFFTSADLVVGRGLITPVRANEVLLEGKLAAKGAGAGLSITIPEGMRAVSVRVDEVIGVAGFVLPGTRVDVLLTLPPKLERKETVTQMILQNMRVLAAGQIVQQDAQGKPIMVSVLTLMVTPEEGELLVLAANEGKIQLALRNTLDDDDVRTNGINTRRLLPGDRAAAARSSAAAAGARTQAGVPVVEAYRGGVRTLIKF